MLALSGAQGKNQALQQVQTIVQATLLLGSYNLGDCMASDLSVAAKDAK